MLTSFNFPQIYYPFYDKISNKMLNRVNFFEKIVVLYYYINMKNLSKSYEDYIETIYCLEKKTGKVMSVDIARELNVSKPAVHKAMDELTSLGYIFKEPYGRITLTESGKKVAEEIYDKHTSIKSFLLSLGIDEKTAEHDCCLIEHVISDETLNKIKEFLKNK